MLNENMIDKTMSLLKRMDFKKTKKFLEREFDKFVEAVQITGLEPEVVTIINKGFNTRYKSMRDIQRLKLRESDEGLNEDAAHWWKVVQTELFPTLAFYPALSVWLELDKLFQGQDMDLKKVIIYSLFWVLLVSGKYVKGWMEWKKQNPEEHAAERAVGKGGLF